MMDRTDFEVNRLDGTEGPFDLTEAFVTTHRIVGRQALLGDAGADDVDAVECRLTRYLLCIQGELESVIPDIENEMLGDLVLVNDLAYAYSNLILAPEPALPHQNTHLFQCLTEPCKSRL